MTRGKLRYDYGKGEVSTTFEEFAVYVDRPVYEVKEAYVRFGGNLGLTAMHFRSEDMNQAAVRNFAELFSCNMLSAAGYGMEECLKAYGKCCYDVRTHLIRQFCLPQGAGQLILPRYILWMFTLNFCKKDGPFYTETEWERLLTFGDPPEPDPYCSYDDETIALTAEEIREADDLVRGRRLSPVQAADLLIRVMERRKE